MSNELTHNPGQFDEVIHIIDNARSRAMKAVNAELIQMYWEIGSYVSGRVKGGGWGKGVVADFSEFLQAHYPGTKGFSAQNIWRMKQFYPHCDGKSRNRVRSVCSHLTISLLAPFVSYFSVSTIDSHPKGCSAFSNCCQCDRRL